MITETEIRFFELIKEISLFGWIGLIVIITFSIVFCRFMLRKAKKNNGYPYVDLRNPKTGKRMDTGDAIYID